MSKEMLINVSEGEECRIALLEKGRLQELYMERTSATSHVGNIYKGRVTNVEASIQAAFIDFGLGRNGFLHISDLMPSYFGTIGGRDGSDFQESVGRKLSRRDRPPIQRCLRRGDEIIVQIIKEGIGTKGPTLSTYVSIPGRILVMMPGMGKFGVSRKIEDDEERHRLRMILDGLKPIKDVGFIIRTAGIGKTGQEIERDLTYLTRLWENIQRKMREAAPVELYTEGDLVTRTVRDAYSSDLSRIVVDNIDVAKRIQEFFKIAMPKNRARIELYDSPVPLFHQANIEREIDQMNSRHVPLPSGGSLVIDSTEAVVAIDVNSGKFRDHSDAEMTAFKTDMEAADEIPRQLKLRDLGGVIICDFIDLRFERNRRELEERLHSNFKNDRAKTKVLRMSQFGIIELTRQRMRPSLKRSIYFDCPHCKGGGLVKTPESMSLDVMRRLAIAAYDPRVARVELTVGAEVGMYVLNKKRAELTALETDSGRRIIVGQDALLGLDDMKLMLYDARDGSVYLQELGMDPNDDQADEPRKSAVRRDRRPRGGRPLPRGRNQDSGDELDDAEDAVDQHDHEMEAAVIPPPLKPRAISRVPLGKVIGKLLTDDGGLFDDRESSVIEVDEPHEPLGDGPQEFEEDRWNPRGRSGGANGGQAGNQAGGQVGAPERGRARNFNRNDRIDNRRPPARPPLNSAVRSPASTPPHSDEPMDEVNGNRIGPDDAGGELSESNGENGDQPRRRRRRGRRGRGRGRNGEESGNPPTGAEGPAEVPGRDDREPGDGGDEFSDRDHADAAFGTSDSGLSTARDSVGSAGEEIDAEAIDAEFGEEDDDRGPTDDIITGESENDSGISGDEAGRDAESDRPRRRRRRGGRRHRRNRDESEPATGTAASAGLPTSDASAGQSDDDDEHSEIEDTDAEEIISDEQTVAVTPFHPVAEDEFDDARDAMSESLAEADEEEDAADATEEKSPSLRAREIEAGIQSEPSAAVDGAVAEAPAKSRGTRRGRSRSARTNEDEEATPLDEAMPADDEPAEKPKRRGVRGGGVRTPRRATRKPPAIEPTPSASPPASKPVAMPVERTGSTDRHLVDDVPIDPEPPRRPRSYEDLDAVPDDFD